MKKKCPLWSQDGLGEAEKTFYAVVLASFKLVIMKRVSLCLASDYQQWCSITCLDFGT